MTHLKIEQNNGTIEQVDASVVKKLYQLALSRDLDATSNLIGRLHATATYQEYIDELHTEYPEFYITASKYYLNVGDPEFERICAVNWGDGTGVVQADLEAVTDSSPYTAFKDNTTITDATGFKYFTNMSAVGANVASNRAPFKGCTSLIRCTLPSQIKTTASQTSSADWGWFSGCSNLVQCVLPAGLERIGQYMFYNCGSLTSVNLEDTSLTIINAHAFRGCSSLTSITLPDTLEDIRSYVFQNCSSLQTITIPKSVKSIKEIIFDGCSQLSSIIFESGGTEGLTFDTGNGYNNNIFAMGNTTTLLKRVEFPERLTNLSKHPFRNSTLTTIIFNGTTPPTVTDGLALPGGATIYVPDVALTDYQAANGFSSVTGQIKGISELPS